MPTRRHEPARAVVHPQRFLADVVGAQREGPVHDAQGPARAAREQHDVLAVLQPDLEQQHRHQVPEVDEAEHRHRRRRVGREVHLERALGMPEVQLQRQRRDEQEGERGEQGEPVGRLHRLHAEHALERGEDEGTRHEAGDEGIEHDQDAPLQLHLVGVHVPFDAVQDGFHTLAGARGALSPPMARSREPLPFLACFAQCRESLASSAAFRFVSGPFLPDRPVEPVVVGLRARRHLRLQHLHLVGAQELVDRVLRVLEVAQHAARRSGRPRSTRS